MAFQRIYQTQYFFGLCAFKIRCFGVTTTGMVVLEGGQECARVLHRAGRNQIGRERETETDRDRERRSILVGGIGQFKHR